MKQLFVSLLLFFLFFAKTSVAFAGDVVINEFLVDPDADQWVELYNKGGGSVDVSGWVIDDSGGSQHYTISPGTIINASEYKVFSSSLFNFNRSSADTVRLFNGSLEEDSYSYPTGPGMNNTYGRVIDGTGHWGIFISSTKGSTNNASTPQPTPTIQPSATPTPSKTPSPTNPPTPTKSPTPTKTPAPTKSPTITKTPTTTKGPTHIQSNSSVKNTPVSNAIATNVLPTKTRDVPTAVLGERTMNSPSPEVTDGETKVLGTSGFNFSSFFIIIGSVFLLTCAILIFFRMEKMKHER